MGEHIQVEQVHWQFNCLELAAVLFYNKGMVYIEESLIIYEKLIEKLSPPWCNVTSILFPSYNVVAQQFFFIYSYCMTVLPIFQHILQFWHHLLLVW